MLPPVLPNGVKLCLGPGFVELSNVPIVGPRLKWARFKLQPCVEEPWPMKGVLIIRWDSSKVQWPTVCFFRISFKNLWHPPEPGMEETFIVRTQRWFVQSQPPPLSPRSHVTRMKLLWEKATFQGMSRNLPTEETFVRKDLSQKRHLSLAFEEPDLEQDLNID